MNGLYGRTIPEALTGGLTGGEHDQPRLILVEADGQDHTFTAPQLCALIRSAAWQARSAGIRPGEPVLLVFEHGLPVIQAFLGLVMAGAVPCLLPYWSGSAATHTAAEVHRLAATSGARWIVTSSALAGTLGELLASEPLRLFALQGQDTEFTDEAPPLPELDAEATAYLQLTSGTTDVPKLIAVSHRALLNHMRALHSHLALAATDTFVGWLPLHHDMGLIIQLWLPLIASVRTVLIPPGYWVRRPRVLLQAVSRYAGTITFMPNFAFNHCMRYVSDNELRDLDLTRWRRVINGAEPVCAAAMQAFAEHLAACGLPKTALGVGYGLGENVGGVTISRSGQPLLVDWISALALQESNQAVTVAPTHGDALAVVSCGHPIPGTEVAILNEQRQAVPDGGLGEIAIRGDSLCNAYAGVGPIPDDTGWCLTGDIGYLRDGQLYVCDRKTDLIITGGRNIHPQWLEGLAADVMGASAGQAAAFAVTDSWLGTELPVLVCEARGKFDADQQAGWAAEIRRRAQDELHISLADIQVVRRGWVEQTTSGKIARKATRDKYLAAGYRPELPGLVLLRAGGNDQALLKQALTALFTAMLGGVKVEADDSFFDLGGDSLSALRMLLAVEEATGQHVPVEFFQQPTVACLVGLLASHAPPASPAPPLHRPRPAERSHSIRQRSPLVRRGPLLRRHALPYGLGVRLQRAWLTLPGVQRVFFDVEIALLRRWGERIGTPPDARVVLESLLANTWEHWRTRALAAPPGTSPWVTAQGDLAPWQPRGEDVGVIFLVMHSTLSALFARSCTAGGMRTLFVGGATGETESGDQDRAIQVYKAHQALNRGEPVIIAGDGGQGKQGVIVPFCGGERRFFQGAAELAVQTDVRLIPVFSTINADGRVAFDICAPLDRGAGSAQAQIERLTRAYAELVVARWPQVYHCQAWGNLARRLDMLEKGQV
jgi:fatty-acyl-CoA synthase